MDTVRCLIGELYLACFGLLPTTVGNYLKPLHLIPALREAARTGKGEELKGNILEGLGRNTEAARLKEQAEFLTEGNWSERSAIR